MALPKLTKPELQIMEALWSHGPSSIREIHESFPAKNRLAYTTVQTMVYRLEIKKAVRRVKKICSSDVGGMVTSGQCYHQAQYASTSTHPRSRGRISDDR